MLIEEIDIDLVGDKAFAANPAVFQQGIGALRAFGRTVVHLHGRRWM
jgi:hypothetical protein